MPGSGSMAALPVLPVLPTGTIAVLAHNTICAFVVILMGLLLTAMPVLAEARMRCQTQRVWLEYEKRRLQALDRLDSPQHVLEWLQLSVGPLGRPLPAEVPAPPIAARGNLTAPRQDRAG